MSKIGMTYVSNTGNTEAMAELIKEGIEAAGAEVTVCEASDVAADELMTNDVIVLGCPACGTEELDEDYMQPLMDEIESGLSEKKVALFGSFGWGGGEYMEDWKKQIEDAGATLVAEPITNLEAPEDDDVQEALKELGQKIAKA